MVGIVPAWTLRAELCHHEQARQEHVVYYAPTGPFRLRDYLYALLHRRPWPGTPFGMCGQCAYTFKTLGEEWREGRVTAQQVRERVLALGYTRADADQAVHDLRKRRPKLQPAEAR